MKAKDLLTSLQMAGRSYHSNKKFLYEAQKGLKSEIYKGVIKRLEDDIKKMPTDYQDSHFYHIIKDSFNSLTRTIAENKIEFDGTIIQPEKVPLFGTADFAGYNAFVEADDEKVIVFNNDLLKFTQHMIEIYTKEHWLYSKGLMNKYIQKVLAQNFVDTMLCFHIFSNAYATIPLELCEIDDLDNLDDQDILYNLTSSIDELIDFEQYNYFEDQIRLSVYQWIAAHEYAHIVLGHLDENNDIKRLNLCGHDVTEINFSYHKEYDADLLGASITLESCDLLFPANGICLAMYCILLSQLDDESERSSSHPPIEHRIEKVFSLIENNKQVLSNNYRIVDKIISFNLNIFKKIINEILRENILFKTPIEMQKFIYKNCKIFDELLQ